MCGLNYQYLPPYDIYINALYVYWQNKRLIQNQYYKAKGMLKINAQEEVGCASLKLMSHYLPPYGIYISYACGEASRCSPILRNPK